MDVVWLRHRGVQALLNRIVDELDRAQAEGRALTRAIKLNARFWPAFFDAPLESEREELWGRLNALVAGGWLVLKTDRGELDQAPYERNPRITVADERAIRAAVGRHERVRPYSEQWRDAVTSTLEGDSARKEAVARYLIEIPGRTAAEVVDRLNGLHAVRDAPLLLREVSSQLFWGMSKVFDTRQALVAAVLGLEECPFPEMPVQLQVFLPSAHFSGVLFIENQAVFERATATPTGAFAGLALVFASGFKGSAKRLRTPKGVSLYFAAHGDLGGGARERFQHWLFDNVGLPCWFWGDLDYSGMGILRALRGSFAGLEAWEAGYAPMHQALLRGDGHAPDAAGKTGQAVVESTGCRYADDVLLPALHRTRVFVDQESIVL